MGPAASRPGSNPFRTCAVRPGAIPFRFPASSGPQAIVRRLAEHRWWGEIIGAHGSGKSTLVEALTESLQENGRQVIQLTVRPGRISQGIVESQESRVQSQNTPKGQAVSDVREAAVGSLTLCWALLRGSVDPVTDWNQNTLVVVDGYEQLGGASRWLLKRRCRQEGCGLLVTAHCSVGLPTIFETQVTRQLARELVHDLLPPNCQLIRTEDVDSCFDRHPGNLRETLFALYDVYERRTAHNEPQPRLPSTDH